jgi:hypothetical protein
MNELTKEEKIKIMEANNIPVMTEKERLAYERERLLHLCPLKLIKQTIAEEFPLNRMQEQMTRLNEKLYDIENRLDNFKFEIMEMVDKRYPVLQEDLAFIRAVFQVKKDKEHQNNHKPSIMDTFESKCEMLCWHDDE